MTGFGSHDLGWTGLACALVFLFFGASCVLSLISLTRVASSLGLWQPHDSQYVRFRFLSHISSTLEYSS